MVVLSKSNFDFIEQKHGFCAVLHHGRDSCFNSQMREMPAGAKGAGKFFLIMYSAQLLFEFKKIKKSDIVPLLISFLRSIAFTMCYQNLFFLGACFGMRLMRKVMSPYYVASFLSPFLSGLSSFVDDPKRRVIVSTTFTALAIEALLRRTYVTGLAKRSKTVETLAFMFLNAYVTHRMTRKYESHEKHRKIWFFTPKPVTTSHSATHFILKETAKFVSIGCLISMFKTLASPQEKSLINDLLSWKSLKIPTTVGSYIFLYYVVRQLLSLQSTKGSMPRSYSSVISGFLAGSSYYLNPNLTVLSTLILQVLKDLGEMAATKLGLPSNYPFWETSFIAANVVLLNTRLLVGEACPKAFNEMINCCTMNRELGSGVKANLYFFPTSRVDGLVKRLHLLKE